MLNNSEIPSYAFKIKKLKYSPCCTVCLRRCSVNPVSSSGPLTCSFLVAVIAVSCISRPLLESAMLVVVQFTDSGLKCSHPFRNKVGLQGTLLRTRRLITSSYSNPQCTTFAPKYIRLNTDPKYLALRLNKIDRHLLQKFRQV